MHYREKKAKDEALLSAKVKVAWEEEAEEQTTLEQERQREEKQRQLIQKLQELEVRQAANNLKVGTITGWLCRLYELVIIFCTFVALCLIHYMQYRLQYYKNSKDVTVVKHIYPLISEHYPILHDTLWSHQIGGKSELRRQ